MNLFWWHWICPTCPNRPHVNMDVTSYCKTVTNTSKLLAEMPGPGPTDPPVNSWKAAANTDLDHGSGESSLHACFSPSVMSWRVSRSRQSPSLRLHTLTVSFERWSERFGAQTTSWDRNSGVRPRLRCGVSGLKRTLCLWDWPASLQVLNHIKLEKDFSNPVFHSCDETDSTRRIRITCGYFRPNYVPRGIITQQHNSARTAANSFTLKSAQTCGFSSCLFSGRTSTYRNGCDITFWWQTRWPFPPDGYPLTFGWWQAQAISQNVNLESYFITGRCCGASPPPPARTAAFQFYIKPITLLGLLKRVLHDKIGSELWNYHQHPRSHFLPCSSFIPTLCYLHSFHLIFHFLSSWLSLSSAPLSECSSAMAACKNGIWWGWYQTARPKSHFLLVKETRSAQKWLCTIWLILNPLWYLI